MDVQLVSSFVWLVLCLILGVNLVQMFESMRHGDFADAYSETRVWLPFVTIALLVVSGFVLLWGVYV
jgi:hypothetical protein